MSTPSPSSGPNRRTLIYVALAIIVAIIVGGIGSRVLLGSSAATKVTKVTKVTAATTASEKYGVLQAKARAHPVPKVVPFFGPFGWKHKGMTQCGPAVRLMEGALRHTKPPIRKTPAANCVGKATYLQIKLLQKRNGIPQSGIYGTVTHKALSIRYTATQRSDLLYLAHVQLLNRERASVLLITSHAQLVGQGMRYSQSNRFYFPAWPAVQSSGDCSSFATWVLYQAGVGYRVGYFGPGSPIGWTGTLGRQGLLVPRSAPLHVGDLLFYGGGYPYGHVEVYVGHGRSIGHGSPGVHNHPYNYRPVVAVRRFIF